MYAPITRPVQRLACGLAIACLAAPSGAATLLAGDVDNAASYTTVPDDAMPRPQYAVWLANEINNRVYHSNQPLEFDQTGSDHWFGHSFRFAIGDIDLTKPVTLTMKLYGNAGSNDSVGFQAYDGPTSSSSSLTAPRFMYASGITAFHSSYGVGTTATNGEMVVDLRNLVTTNGPSTLVGQSVAQTANTLGYLDVMVADDSSVDYLRLDYTAVPEPTSGCVALLAIGGIAAARRRLG